MKGVSDRSAVLRKEKMAIHRQLVSEEMSAEASLRVAAAWGGAVGAGLLIMVLIRVFG
jgi:hypothetical protein